MVIQSFHKIQDETYDIIIESVGWQQEHTLNQSIRLAKRKGIILVFGVFPTNYFMPFYARNLFYKEITLAGSNSYGYYNNISEFEMAYSIIHHKQNEYKSVLQNMYYIDDFKQWIIRGKNPFKTIFYF